MKNTYMKSTYCGTKEVYDEKSGESERAVLIKPTMRDRNFIKIYLPPEGEYRMKPEGMTLASIDLFSYVCIVMDKTSNVAIVNTSEVESRIGMSTASIARAKDQLYKFDYIRKKAANIYMVNPEVAFHKDAESRVKADEVYRSLPRKTKPKGATNE